MLKLTPIKYFGLWDGDRRLGSTIVFSIIIIFFYYHLYHHRSFIDRVISFFLSLLFYSIFLVLVVDSSYNTDCFLSPSRPSRERSGRRETKEERGRRRQKNYSIYSFSNTFYLFSFVSLKIDLGPLLICLQGKSPKSPLILFAIKRFGDQESIFLYSHLLDRH